MVQEMYFIGLLCSLILFSYDVNSNLKVLSSMHVISLLIGSAGLSPPNPTQPGNGLGLGQSNSGSG